MRRRTYIAAAGAGLAALAGCSTAVGEVAVPEVPQSRLDEGGWTQTDENQRTVLEEDYGPVTVTAKAHSLTYSDAALRSSVREKTLGSIDARLAVFSATHIDFAPDLNNLPGGIGRAEILDQTEQAARSQFRSRLTDAGLQDVSRTGTGTLTVDTGEEASVTEYEAAYPVEGIDTSLPNGESLTIDLSDVTVAGELAVWNHEDYVVVGGGAYPSENVAATETATPSDAISITVDIDLGLTPDDYREELRGLITALE